MKKEYVAFVLILLASLGIVSIGLAYVMIWHGEIVLTVLRFAAALIPAATVISILLACRTCGRKIESKTEKTKGA